MSNATTPFHLSEEDRTLVTIALGAGWEDEFVPEDELVERLARFEEWIIEARMRMAILGGIRAGEVKLGWDGEDWVLIRG